MNPQEPTTPANPPENAAQALPAPIPAVPGVQTAPPTAPPLGSRRYKTYWGGIAMFSSGLTLLGFQVFLGIAGVILILAKDGLGAVTEDPTLLFTKYPLFLLVTQLSMYALWLGHMWWVTRYRSGVTRDRSWWTAFKDNFRIGFKWVDIPLGIGAAVVILGFQLLILNVLPQIFPNLNMEGASNTGMFTSMSGVWFFIMAIGVGTIIGPISEELFFRGFLMRGFENMFTYSQEDSNITDLEEVLGKSSTGFAANFNAFRRWLSTKRTLFAVLITSVLFGFMHFQGADTFGQWMVVVVTGALGLILGILTVKTNRISAAIIAHILMNGTAFAMLILGQ